MLASEQCFFSDSVEVVIIHESSPALSPPVVDADVTVVGSGPGGYVAAIKAAQLGFKVTSSTCACKLAVHFTHAYTFFIL